MTLVPFNRGLPSGWSKNRRPLLYPGGATFNISFRLNGSITRRAYYQLSRLWKQYEGNIPQEVYQNATAEERIGFRQFYAGTYDRRSLNGPFHLHHDPACQKILKDAFAFREGKHYYTYAYSIMPNHVHWVVRHMSDRWHMGQLLANLKRHVARQSNLVLGLTGQPYWQDESWDRVVRTGSELERSIWYCLQNPVVSQLCCSWEEWDGNYCEEKLRLYFGSKAKRA